MKKELQRVVHKLASRLAEKTKEPEPPLVWMFGCKHGLPNFVICPECDR